MLELSEESHGLSFRRAVWLWTKLGQYTGCCRQEFAMEKKNQVYVKPDGTQVVSFSMMKTV